MTASLTRGARVGEYVVDGLVGQGAFGAVYRGVQPVIGKMVAIKVLHRQDPETTARFINEARAVNAIRHPNLVDIFAFGQLEDGRHYLVMEWLEGEPLDAYLERVGGRLAPGAILPILNPIARALDAAHRQGVIHRDLKPSNIALSVHADGQLVPKLLDFGIAKLVDDESPHQHATRTGRAIGTPEFMSPEQCQGPDIDHRTDVYAFGALLFRMLTGSAVFEAPHVVELLMKHLREAPPRPSAVNARLPRGLDAPVLAMLAKDRAERPADLQEAMGAFRKAVEDAGLETDLAPPPVVPRPRPDIAIPLTEPGLAKSATTNPVIRAKRVGGLALAVGVTALAALPFLLDAREPAVERSAPPTETSRISAGDAPRPSPTPHPPSPTRASDVPSDSAPEPRTVLVSFEGAPAGTTVLLPSGNPVGTTPGPMAVPYGDTPLELRLEKKGFLPTRTQVVPDRPQTIAVVLKRRRPRRKTPRAPPAKPAPHKDSVENPY